MKNPNRCVGAGLLGRPLLLLVSALCLWSSLRLHSGQWGDFSYERLGDAITITAYKGSQRSVTIPETIEGLPVTTLITSEWWGGELVAHVYLPASLTWLRGTFPFRWSKSLQSIEVARDNPIFSSRDGILFNKDLTRLIRCPIAWPREQFIIPDTVTHIEAGAFGGCLTLTRVGPLRTDNAGLWRVVVSNSFGVVTSQVSSVTVRLPAQGGYEAAVLAQRPLAYWPLDEIIDRTLPEYVGGDHGRFADDTGEVQVEPDAAPRLGTGHFTVAAWIRPSSSDGDLAWRYAEYIPWDYGNAIWNRGWSISMQGLGLRLFASTIRSGDMGEVQSPAGVLTLNEWQHVAVSCRRDHGVGAEVGRNTTGNRWTTIYRNGVLVASGDIGTGDLDNPEHPLSIGIWSVGAFPNTIRDFALFGQALSEDQIASLYAAGIGAVQSLRVTRSPAGLTLTWSSGLLQSASTLGDGRSGPNWADLPGATSPYTIETTSGASFFRVRAH